MAGSTGTTGMAAAVLSFVVLLAITVTHLPGKEDA